MPTLPELQRAFARALSEPGVVALDIAAPMAARLEIYANTRRATLEQALRLNFPAVHALVGADFFAALARDFAAATPPASAYLNEYGAGLAPFLCAYAPAASLAYLSDVARLEWAVSCAWHAPDAPRLDAHELAQLAREPLAGISFIAHPSVATLRLDYPADRIWRAVLERDEAAMRAIALSAGPVHVLVERDLEGQVQVSRLAPAAWKLTQRLISGEPWCQVLSHEQSSLTEAAWAESAPMILARHLSAGRFTGYRNDAAAEGRP